MGHNRAGDNHKKRLIRARREKYRLEAKGVTIMPFGKQKSTMASVIEEISQGQRARGFQGRSAEEIEISLEDEPDQVEANQVGKKF